MEKIAVNWSLCDGNGACAIEAPSHFELNDDDELIVLNENVAPEDREVVERAVRACPKHALEIVPA